MYTESPITDVGQSLNNNRWIVQYKKRSPDKDGITRWTVVKKRYTNKQQIFTIDEAREQKRILQIAGWPDYNINIRNIDKDGKEQQYLMKTKNILQV